MAVLLPSPTSNAFSIPVWHIVDPMRDGNWWLKQAREAILQTERLTLYAKRMLQDKAISTQNNLIDDKNASVQIQGITTAVSTTRNAASEERYVVDDNVGSVCSLINNVGFLMSQDGCQEALAEQDRRYTMINQSLGGEQFESQMAFYDHIIEQSHTSNQSDQEKQIVESMAIQITDTGRNVTSYSLLNNEQFKKTMASVDAIFSKNMAVPKADEIQRLKLPNGAHQLDDLRKSLLYRAFVEDNLQRRLLVDGLARDGAVINYGSLEEYVNSTDTIHDSLMTPSVTRVQALNTAKLLDSTFVELRQSLQRQAVNALKYKELRDKHD